MKHLILPLTLLVAGCGNGDTNQDVVSKERVTRVVVAEPTRRDIEYLLTALGSVESISVQRASGMPELDQAAQRIVRLAAPYAPLPAEISRDVDVLHITRTWRFSHGNRFE